MRQLTALDAQFLALESPRQAGHVGAVAVLDPATRPNGRLELADIQNMIAERLPLLPPFRWRLKPVPLGLDYPYWIDDPDFDLEYHVRELAIASPPTDEKLADQVARIFSRPLDRTRPLWEVYVIHGLARWPRRGDDEDPSLADRRHVRRRDHGRAARSHARRVVSCRMSRRRRWRSRTASPASGRCSSAGCSALPRYADAGCPRAARDAAEHRGRRRAGADLRARSSSAARRRRSPGCSAAASSGCSSAARSTPPRTQFNGHVSPHRRFAFGQLSLADVKAVKNAHGCTVNDVVLSLCAGAVRRWLIEHDDLPERSARRAGAGVGADEEAVRHLRQPDRDAERAAVHQRGRPGGAADARPRRDGRSPRSGTRRCRPSCSRTRPSSSRPRCSHARRGSRSRSPRPASRSGTSSSPTCPARSSRCTWPGARLVANYPVSVITDGMGLNITVMSYDGHLDFGIVADREQMRDVWKLIDWLGDELERVAA